MITNLTNRSMDATSEQLALLEHDDTRGAPAHVDGAVVWACCGAPVTCNRDCECGANRMAE